MADQQETSVHAEERSASAGGGGRMDRMMWLASGLLVAFFASGFGSWFSGAASWVGFYLGAREGALIRLAQVTAVAGFAIGIMITVAWYWRRCRRGEVSISPRAALVACIVLPLGNIFWAIFVDAIAYHHGQDLVRPAFDDVIMYVVLGGIVPLALGVPWLISRLRRYAP